MDRETIRNIRLQNDYSEMLKLKDTPVISWTAIKGTPPAVSEYLVTLRIKTYIAPDVMTDICHLRITLPEDYPLHSPDFRIEDTPIFHPAFFADGRYGSYQYSPATSLPQWVQRIFIELQYKEISCLNAPSNNMALHWYLENKDNDKMFPCDDTAFPRIHEENRYRFVLHRNENLDEIEPSDDTLESATMNADDDEDDLPTSVLLQD